MAKPAEIRKLLGTFRESREKEIRELLLTELPQPPAVLDGDEEAKQWWTYYAEDLFARGLFATSDLASLAMLASETARYWRLVKQINKMEAQGVVDQHFVRLSGLAVKTLALIRALQKAFGFDARSRQSIKRKKDDNKSAAEDFFE